MLFKEFPSTKGNQSASTVSLASRCVLSEPCILDRETIDVGVPPLPEKHSTSSLLIIFFSVETCPGPVFLHLVNYMVYT